MIKITKNYGLDLLGHTQHNVDFLDLYLGIDNLLFLDYNKIILGDSPLFRSMKNDLDAFMKSLFAHLSSNQDQNMEILLEGLHESNSTHLGMSKGNPRGNSVGNELKEKIFENLHILKDAMMRGNQEINSIHFGIEQIGPDRISDIVTSIVKSRLIFFTQEQCRMHGIPMQNFAVTKIFNSNNSEWTNGFFELPVYDNKPVIFIPKSLVSTHANISGTFHSFVRYGFKNFYKNSLEYKKKIRGKGGDLESELTRKEFDSYNKEHGINEKAVSQKILTEFENKDVINLFAEIRRNIVTLTDDELIEIIENILREAN